MGEMVDAGETVTFEIRAADLTGFRGGAIGVIDDDAAPERPAHYRRGGVECRDVEEALLSDSDVDALTAHLWMDALEYLWRWDLKGGVADLRKAARCVEEMARRAESKSRGGDGPAAAGRG